MLAGTGMPPRAGYSLPREFYTDAAIFEQDMERMLLKHWFCAGHVSSLPKAGDYFLAELGAESVIVCRAADGQLHALLNVCRHRGSRVCVARAGTAQGGGFTCPYHAWSYGLDGRLRAAREMPASFRHEDAGLKRLALRVLEGLIFISFAASPPALDDAARALANAAGTHGWANATVAHQARFGIGANWKLALENYMECYHCQPAHPEFARRHANARPWAQAADLERSAHERSRALGIGIHSVDHYALESLPGQESVSVLRSALLPGHLTGSADGQQVAPLMGAFPQHDGNSTYFDIGPISDFLAYADHGLIYRFIPRSVDRTELEVIWLVDAAAEAGRDYDLERLSWLWQLTSMEDKQIIERNQEGVNSRYYEPGQYSLQEDYASRFVAWYLAELGVTSPAQRTGAAAAR
ncbi:MAG: aromatic ring-hydroxylating dioxygenase subunit alpha [Gammaproteobacteria bacterium]|nr:aromatic ring-hydroxylating dioxygenase subunit alpha [Gammaproteobacteria bacterium]